MCVGGSADIDTAARRLVAADIHHLVVVDGAGVAAQRRRPEDCDRGIVSVLDVCERRSAFPRARNLGRQQ
jgi:hypothetical protein